MTTVNVKVIASVSAKVLLSEGETISDLKKRDVDIYLHAAGENGYADKKDLGAHDYEIIVPDEEELVAVSKGMLLALIESARNSSSLDAVYDDKRKTSYSWEQIEKVQAKLNAGGIICI